MEHTIGVCKARTAPGYSPTVRILRFVARGAWVTLLVAFHGAVWFFGWLGLLIALRGKPARQRWFADRLARLLEIDTVPMSVERDINGKTAAVTWWVDDVQMDEKGRLQKKTMGPDPLRTSHQIQVMRIWDELIQNRDRNQGNILWTNDWTMWLIDHTRAFRLGKELMKPSDLARCDRGLLARLKGLTPESIEKAVGDSLMKGEREAVLARRDRIVQVIEDRAAKLGARAREAKMTDQKAQAERSNVRCSAICTASLSRAQP